MARRSDESVERESGWNLRLQRFPQGQYPGLSRDRRPGNAGWEGEDIRRRPIRRRLQLRGCARAGARARKTGRRPFSGRRGSDNGQVPRAEIPHTPLGCRKGRSNRRETQRRIARRSQAGQRCPGGGPMVGMPAGSRSGEEGAKRVELLASKRDESMQTPLVWDSAQLHVSYTH